MVSFVAVQKHHYISHEPMQLELGEQLQVVEITYHTAGTLNEDKSNVVWICHALTANSDPSDWWNGLVGEGKYFDTKKYFIVCANIIGSCYGSSGPLTTNPATDKPYYSDFPIVTIRDIVNAHQLLQAHLGIDKILIGAGGSMGGYQLLEWELAQPGLFRNLLLAVTGARESAWGKAIHASQRLAIEADHTWKNHDKSAGVAGMKAARAIGMLTYRNYETYVLTQSDESPVTENFRAESYINYQGEKLVKRFNAYTYWLLTRAMDSHDISRNRDDIKKILNGIESKTLVIGVKSDILCPIAEQEFLNEHLPNSKLVVLDSNYGHDGFLIEFDAIITELTRFFTF